MTSRCRACGAEIRWERTAARDRAIPLDPDPIETGNVVLDDDGRAVVLGAGSLDLDGGRPRYMPHHATCPNWPPRARPR